MAAVKDGAESFRVLDHLFSSPHKTPLPVLLGSLAAPSCSLLHRLPPLTSLVAYGLISCPLYLVTVG